MWFLVYCLDYGLDDFGEIPGLGLAVVVAVAFAVVGVAGFVGPGLPYSVVPQYAWNAKAFCGSKIVVKFMKLNMVQQKVVIHIQLQKFLVLTQNLQ